MKVEGERDSFRKKLTQKEKECEELSYENESLRNKL